QSELKVGYPAPLLREVQTKRIEANVNTAEVARISDPQIQDGTGQVNLNVSNTRVLELHEALQQLLHYPYGCVEQTTSNMLPWLALSKYEPMFPNLLEKGKVQSAIRRGADRLLQMQTDEGGLSYWPGGDTPELWASAYGGFGLIKA